MSKLVIETDNTKSFSVMKLKGRVDSDTAPQLDSALSNLLNSSCNKIVLDLRNVEFFSSAGLRAIVKALKQAQKSGGDVRLAAASESLAGILLTVGMNQMFKTFPTTEEAVAGF